MVLVSVLVVLDVDDSRISRSRRSGRLRLPPLAFWAGQRMLVPMHSSNLGSDSNIQLIQGADDMIADGIRLSFTEDGKNISYIEPAVQVIMSDICLWLSATYTLTYYSLLLLVRIFTIVVGRVRWRWITNFDSLLVFGLGLEILPIVSVWYSYFENGKGLRCACFENYIRKQYLGFTRWSPYWGPAQSALVGWSLVDVIHNLVCFLCQKLVCWTNLKYRRKMCILSVKVHCIICIFAVIFLHSEKCAMAKIISGQSMLVESVLTTSMWFISFCCRCQRKSWRNQSINGRLFVHLLVELVKRMQLCLSTCGCFQWLNSYVR